MYSKILMFLKGLAVVALLGASTVSAQLNVAITGVGSNLYPIAVANFEGEAGLLTSFGFDKEAAISAIIRNDLASSGRFSVINTDSIRLSATDPVDLGAWKAKGADAVVSGSVIRLADGRYNLRFRLSDSLKNKNLGGLSLISPESGLRISAHKAADYIYENLLGERSAFATRFSYVIQSKERYQLQVADSDGQNPQVALTSSEPIMSPSWSPDGSKIAYVSFERKKPVVYLHDLATGARKILSNRRGSNSAPAWSADGKQIALALSLAGNTQIYVMQADGTGLRRISNRNGIDTEPQFSVDGQSLYFVSDRGGNPQIYQIALQGEANGARAKRVTFTGTYNTNPKLSPDGKWLAYISRVNGEFKLHLQNLATGESTPLTTTSHDESPSFAANSQYLLYATQVDGQDVLATVSVDGRARQVLSVRGSAVRDPSWGPFIHTSGE